MTVKTSYDVKTKEIVVRVPYDPTATYPESKSGKTLAVGTTHGAVPVEGCDSKLKVNLSVWLSKA